MCAVSGGADSIYLLHRLWRLRRELNFTLAAAHFDHRLRGAESAQDMEFVREFVSLCCGRERTLRPDGTVETLPPVELFTGSGDVAARAKETGRGLETARELRYAFLRKTAQDTGAQYIAVAHTAGDNAETLLFHLARGTGLRGLCGMAPKNGDLIRPLLTTTRGEIEDYLRFWGLPWREDPSNREDVYARNRLATGCSLSWRPSIPGSWCGSPTPPSGCVRTRTASPPRRRRPWSGFRRRRHLSLPAEDVARLPQPLAVRAVRALLARASGGDDRCSAAHLEALTDLCRTQDPSAQIDLPGGLTARREYGRLVLTRLASPPPLSAVELALPGLTRAGDWEITCTLERYRGQPQRPLDFFLDRSAAPALTARSPAGWRPADAPRTPRASLKKWYVDEKIPRTLRDQLPVLESGGRVAGAAGLGPDAAFLPSEMGETWHIRLVHPKFGKKTEKTPGFEGRAVVLYCEEEPNMLEKDIQEVLFTEEQLARRVGELAHQITQDYQGREIVLISVLRGSFVFMADLCRRIDLPCTVDFMSVSSYGTGTSSSGQVQITKDLSGNIEGKDILVVEDVLDSGNTCSYLLRVLEQRGPASVRLCTLLDKPDRRVKPVEVHYSGFTIPDAFVVGYGLDYAEHYRNLPYIGILKPEVYGG